MSKVKYNKYARRNDFLRRYMYEQGHAYEYKIDFIYPNLLKCTDSEGKTHSCYVIKTDEEKIHFYDYNSLDEVVTNSYRECRETLEFIKGSPDYKLYKPPVLGRKYISNFLDYEMYKYQGFYGIGYKVYVRQPEYPWSPLVYYYVLDILKECFK